MRYDAPAQPASTCLVSVPICCDCRDAPSSTNGRSVPQQTTLISPRRYTCNVHSTFCLPHCFRNVACSLPSRTCIYYTYGARTYLACPYYTNEARTYLACILSSILPSPIKSPPSRVRQPHGQSSLGESILLNNFHTTILRLTIPKTAAIAHDPYAHPHRPGHLATASAVLRPALTPTIRFEP